ncbi:MAG TPA: c-type cytochrome [Burkholderiales bacterium]|jgi:cytochrome c553
MKIRPGKASWAGCAAGVFALAAALHGTGAQAADAKAGEQKAQVCAACHGPAGKSSNPMYPILAGQPAQFISTALFEFREGKRKNEQMSPMAANLSNADLNDLAAYFSAQPAPAPLRQSTPANVEAGRALALKNACIACHGPKLLGQQQMPRIAGQFQDYLRIQLTAFKNGTRNDLDGTMSSAAQGLSPQDIDVLADYISGLPTQ